MSEDEAVVTLLVVREREHEGPKGEVTMIGGDGGRYFTLPGASFTETVTALRDAGFVDSPAPHATRLRQ